MASAEQISQVRVLLHDPDGSDAQFTDDAIGLAVDQNGTVSLAAGHLWLAKAAAYADLTDVTEGTSRRELGSLHQSALRMAKALGAMDPDDTAPDPTPTLRPARTRAITRV